MKHKTDTGIVIEMVAVAVDPSSSGKGIGTNLTQLVVENATKKGYRVCYAECSSHFSTRALVKSGAKIEKVIKYDEYEFGGGCFSKPTKPFEKA